MAVVIIGSKNNVLQSSVIEFLESINQSIIIIPLNDLSTFEQQEELAIEINSKSNEGDTLLLFDDISEREENHLNNSIIEFIEFIRVSSHLNGGRKNEIQFYKIIYCSILPFEALLKLNPKALILMAPNIYAWTLDAPFEKLKNQIEAPLIHPTTQKLRPFTDYLVGIPIYSNHTGNRHREASKLGVHILFGFASIIHQECQSLLSENALESYRTILTKISAFPIETVKHEQPDSLKIRTLLFALGRELNKMDKVKEGIKYILFLQETIYKQLSKNKIGLIEDEAQGLYLSKKNKGWLHAFQAILFDNKKDMVEDIISCCPNIDHKRIEEDDFPDIIERIRHNDYSCILLDVQLNEKNRSTGIENELGVKLLKKLRSEFPALPIIIITSTNKPWKHRKLVDLKVDAVWVKEGLDENRTPKRSYYNITRLLELIKRATSQEYQFLKRVGFYVKEIELNSNRYWWQKGVIKWEHTEYSRRSKRFKNSKVDHELLHQRIIELLNEGMEMMRNYLKETLMNFDEASGDERLIYSSKRTELPEVNFLAKNIVLQLSKIIELIHGQRRLRTEYDDRINSGIIGGRYLTKREQENLRKKYAIVRGDWIAYYIYHHRNECAHYFEGVKYSFSSPKEDENRRYLTYFTAHLLAYLCSEEQPYFSASEDDFELSKISKDYNVHPDFLERLFKIHSSKPMIKEHLAIYDQIMQG